jgi:hypothetical protein
MGRLIALGVGVVLAGCESIQLGPSTTLGGSAATTIPSYDQPPITAPEPSDGPTPLFAANEMPVGEVRAWAEREPGHQAIWIDRDHKGWITVAFGQDVAERHKDLADAFSGVGGVTVPVDRTMDGLVALQQRVTTELSPPVGSFATSAAENHGIVEVTVGVPTDEVRSGVEQRVAGEPVCLWGRDSSTVPAAEPQRRAAVGGES